MAHSDYHESWEHADMFERRMTEGRGRKDMEEKLYSYLKLHLLKYGEMSLGGIQNDFVSWMIIKDNERTKIADVLQQLVDAGLVAVRRWRESDLYSLTAEGRRDAKAIRGPLKYLV